MAEKEGHVTLPSWSKEPKWTSPMPKSSDAGKIPPRDHVNEFHGLPASTMPRPLKIEGH